MLTSFKGKAKRLDDIDLPREGTAIGVGEDELHAFMDCESAGSGFTADGRLQALFEPHVFYTQLGPGPKRDKAVKAGLAYKSWKPGKYPKDSTSRILAAMKIDEEAALRSASWGLFQIMGYHHKGCGYPTAEAMVRDFMDDEETHLRAVIKFLVNSGIDDELRSLAKLKRPTTPDDCKIIVRVYNGAGYAKNRYHIKFADFHNKWRKIKDTPFSTAPAEEKPKDIMVAGEAVDLHDGKYHEALETIQKMLQGKGYHEVGTPDGKWGNRSQTAVLAARVENSLPIKPGIDEAFLAALPLIPDRKIADARANATSADLAEKGSETIKTADTAQNVGIGAVGVGAIPLVGTILDKGETYSGYIKRASEFIDPVKDFVQDNLMIIVIGVGAYFIYHAVWVKRIRVEAHRTGRDLSL